MPIFTDPYIESENRYECPGCGDRTAAETNPVVCEDCGTVMFNITVPRD